MSTSDRASLRAPTEDGAALIDPPLSEAPQLIEHNRKVLLDFDRVAGFSTGFRHFGRLVATVGAEIPSGELEAKARALFIVSGHQPELFHPGVWLKNFVLSAIAKAVGGMGVNLVIDSDTVRTASIRVPTGCITDPRIVDVPFDVPGDEVPWEERRVLDERLFRSFAERVRSEFGPHLTASVYRNGMILDELWPAAVESKDRMLRQIEKMQAKLAPPGELRPIPPEVLAAKQNLGSSLTFARHLVEREIGLATQELPLALVCITSQFMEFADHLFRRHQEFHAAYNSALADYRSLNGVRNDRHPVPDLTRNGDWYEMPFWVWNDPHDLRRRRAFVRQAGRSWELSDLEGIAFRPPSGNERNMHETLLALLRTGPALRPRALVTTMYARLVLSDLFIHGIGGAKYDEVTDSIIRRFFGIEPPKFITATATFRLPIEKPQTTVEDVRAIERRIRDARYRPESLVRDPLVQGDAALVSSLQALAKEKREYLMHNDLRRCEQEVFHRLDTINRAMHGLLGPVERELRARHAELLDQARAGRLLSSREFSFCLFPAQDLPRRLLALCEVSA